ncbi:MAG: hypothetical protein R6V32_11935 [Bacteroidales bacterium]
MEFKVLQLGTCPDDTIFRFGSGRKDFSYSLALGDLIGKGKPYETAKEMLHKAWEIAKNQGLGEIGLSELNTDTKKLFKYFRWYSDEKGATSVYIKLSGKTETYTLSRNLMESAQAVHRPGKGETVYAWMYRKYNRLVREKKISFYYQVLGNKKTFPTIQFYWDKWAQELWKADPGFALPHTPVGISTDPEEPAFFHFNKTRLKPGPTPAWNGWLSQFPKICLPVFKAWVYSIFEPTNKGRQAVWLHDNGYTGKSSAVQAIALYMGQDASGTISGGSMKTNFAFEPLYGKRLITYGDCKEPNIIRTTKIHSLLGNDAVTIDRKGLPAFTAQLHAKLIIASNIAPQIDFASNNERTRLLYFPLHEADEEVLKRFCEVDTSGKVKRYDDNSPVVKGGNLTAELTSEMNYFIYSCKKCYDKLCPGGQDLVVSPDYLELMKKHCVSEETLRFANLCKQFLEFGDTPEHFVTHGDLLKFYNGVTAGNAYRISGTSDFARFRKYLADVHNIKPVKRKKGAFRQDVFVGITLTEIAKEKAQIWEKANE